MHEFVLSGAPAKRELGIKTLDIAKRLLDYGMHPPTVYFPLLVDEALMVEPTETETRETLDAFAEAIEAILAEAAEDPGVAQGAPYTTPVRRLDEVAANRNPVVRQPLLAPITFAVGIQRRDLGVVHVGGRVDEQVNVARGRRLRPARDLHCDRALGRGDAGPGERVRAGPARRR